MPAIIPLKMVLETALIIAGTERVPEAHETCRVSYSDNFQSPRIDADFDNLNFHIEDHCQKIVPETLWLFPGAVPTLRTVWPVQRLLDSTRKGRIPEPSLGSWKIESLDCLPSPISLQGEVRGDSRTSQVGPDAEP